MTKNLRRWARWVLLVVLMAVGFFHLQQMELDWPSAKGPNFFLGIVALGAFLAHGIQAAMTKAIVHFNGVFLSWPKTLALNCLGGLWGLLFPMGSVGYKSLYLHSQCSIHPKAYVAYYGLAFLANLWSGLAFAFWPIFKTFGLGYVYGTILIFIGLPCLLVWTPRWLKKWKLIPQESNSSLFLLKAFGVFALIQGLGLAVYVLIYAAALSWFGEPWSLPMLMAFVVIQSWLFLAPIVPGNLVILEGAGLWCLTQAGGSPEAALASVAIMRISMLAELILLAPWARHVLPSWGSFTKAPKPEA
jgi:hypothetical protein